MRPAAGAARGRSEADAPGSQCPPASALRLGLSALAAPGSGSSAPVGAPPRHRARCLLTAQQAIKEWASYSKRAKCAYAAALFHPASGGGGSRTGDAGS